jgi:hypothetical protein
VKVGVFGRRTSGQQSALLRHTAVNDPGDPTISQGVMISAAKPAHCRIKQWRGTLEQLWDGKRSGRRIMFSRSHSGLAGHIIVKGTRCSVTEKAVPDPSLSAIIPQASRSL